MLTDVIYKARTYLAYNNVEFFVLSLTLEKPFTFDKLHRREPLLKFRDADLCRFLERLF